MESKASNKMKYVILAVLSILVVILSIGLYVQRRQFRELKEEFDANILAEKSQTKITAEIRSSEKSLSQDDEEKYKNRIKNLETQITDMQEWQDYLKETLNEEGIRAGFPTSNLPQTGFTPQIVQVDKVDEDLMIRRGYSDSFKDFFEENNYHQKIKENLIDLYIERSNVLRDRVPDLFGNTHGNVKGNIEELKRQVEEIRAEYDDKIAELLSQEGLTALKEYEQTSMERDFISEFKRMLGDDKLEKEKEKKLIALMHNERQAALEERSKKLQPYNNTETEPDEETKERIHKINLEWNDELYEKYFSLAEGILSESQMQTYEGYVNMRKANLYGGNININNSEKEEGEE